MAERLYLTDKASDLKVNARLPWVRPFNRTVKPADLEGKCVHRTDTPVVGPEKPFVRAVKAVYPEVKAENRVSFVRRRAILLLPGEKAGMREDFRYTQTLFQR